MDFTVELQPPMAFSLWWMAAVPVLLLLTAALLFFAWKKRNQKPEVAKEERIRQRTVCWTAASRYGKPTVK